MSKIVIVCGLPGSGKTTLSNELSKKTGIACIHKDSIKECLFEKLGLSTLEDSKKIGLPSVAILFRLAEEQMKNNVDIIIESPFNFLEDYQLFESWKSNFGVELFTVICSIDNQERKKRFKERERHHAHHDIDRLMYADIENTEFDYSNIPGKQIKIVTNRPSEILVEEIISQMV